MQAIEGPGLQTSTAGAGAGLGAAANLKWISRAMGGGLRNNCSLRMGYVGVLGSLPDITPTLYRDASPLAVWTLFLIFLGTKEPARFTCRLLSPGLDGSCH